MKKQRIVILIVSLVIFISFGVIVFINHKTDSKTFELNTDDINYLKIVHHGTDYIITNKEKIVEVMQGFVDIKIQEYSRYEKLKDKFSVYGDKNFYKIYCCSDTEGKEVLYENFYVAGQSSNNVLVFNGIKYHIISATDIRQMLAKVTTYCKKPLPNLTVGNIMNVKATGYDKEISSEEAFQIYGEVLNAKPITVSDFQTSEKSVMITTYDDEIITIFFVGDVMYIKYVKENNHMQVSNKDEMYFCKEKNVSVN